MSTAAIICEYNPFHNGHELHIARTKERFDTLVCIMSGYFVQRGEPALLSPAKRAEMAMKAGADLVVMLPVHWSLSSAEGFAAGGVAIAGALGVQALSFGSESGKADELMRAARLLESDALKSALRPFLDTGMSFPAARQAALETIDAAAARCLSSPNDLLGVEYCRAILRQKADIVPFTVRREGAGHDEQTAQGRYGSATMIRQLLMQERAEEAASLMPKYAREIYRNETMAGLAPVTAAAFDTAVTAAMRLMTPERLVQTADVSEGLEKRVLQAARTACTIEDICAAAKSKRYAWTRLRRILWNAFLGLERVGGPPPYLRVLALNAGGAALLKEASLPVISKGADCRNLSEHAQKIFGEDCRAGDIWSLGLPESSAREAGSLMRMSARYFG
ncbi:MAG: nucleotidyltransferase family protein [Clostridia bacterium]|nr:nucleotidyltransferase family protein [Clostridia bacterium]